MKTVSLLLFAATLFAATGVYANPSIPTKDTAGCMEGPLAQFGQYIGNWKIADSTLGQDGKTWTAGQGAMWNFVCLGNGTAIQDFWMPNGGPVGTNLRTYNEKTESWDIAWAVKPQPGLAHITAQQNAQGNIVMHYVNPPADRPLRRITFYPANAQGWRWHLEFSQDAGASWREVYRISATPAE